jgi:predicted glycosyltransferase
MRRGPRIALYGHDTFGLGHLRRNLTLAHRLARDFPDAHLLALTGSSQAHAFALPPRFDFVKVPSVTKAEDGAYRARSLDMSLAEVADFRSRLIDQTLSSFRPDILIVDHAPAGMAGELRVPLDHLRASQPHVGLVLGLRDVIDEPGRVRTDWEREGLLDWMDRTYDRVLVYGARGVGPSPDEYGLSPRLNGRVRFTQYVLWSEPCASPADLRALHAVEPNERLVLATIGGGGDGERVLGALLDAWATLPPPDATLLAVTGPLMSAECVLELKTRALGLPRVRVIEFEPDLPCLVHGADVVVSMGGYNSMTEILSARVPAVVVPRVTPRLEQWIRAEAMAERGLCRVVHPDQATASRLASEIRIALDLGPRTHDLPFGTDGAAQVSREIRELLAEKGARPEARVG